MGFAILFVLGAVEIYHDTDRLNANMKLKVLISVFLVTVSSATTKTDQFKEADELFSKLKPVLLNLFPEAGLKVTHIEKNENITKKTSVHYINYVLLGVKKPVSEKELEGFYTKLKDFFIWTRYWDAMYGAEVLYFSHGYPTEKYAEDYSPSIIPNMNYSIMSAEGSYLNLDIDFISREENTLIVECRLLLTLPEQPDPELKLINTHLYYKGLQRDRHNYEIKFEALNNTGRDLYVATGIDYFSSGSSTLDGYANISIGIYVKRAILEGKIFPPKEYLKIKKICPGGVVPMSMKITEDKPLNGITLCYRTEDIYNGKVNYWTGKTKTKLILPEQSATELPPVQQPR